MRKGSKVREKEPDYSILRDILVNHAREIQNFYVSVISLKSESARRAHMAQELEKANLKYNFFDAIDVRSWQDTPPSYNRKSRSLKYGYDLSLGEIGCFLSHRESWKYCVEKNAPLLVLEDDVTLSSDFKLIIKELLESDLGWEFVRLFGSRSKSNYGIYVDFLSSRTVVEELYDSSGAAAYLLNPAGAKKLLNRSETFYNTVDFYIALRYHHGLRIFSVFPYPVEAAPFPTSIPDRLDRPKTLATSLFRQLFRSVHETREFFWIARTVLIKLFSSWPRRFGGGRT